MKNLFLILILSVVSAHSFSYHKYNMEMGFISGNEALYSSSASYEDGLQVGGLVNFSVGFEYFFSKLISAKFSAGSYSDIMELTDDYDGPSISYSSGSSEAMAYFHGFHLLNNKYTTQFGVGVNMHSNATIEYDSGDLYLEEEVLHEFEPSLGYDFEFRVNTRKINKAYHYYFGYRYNIRNFEYQNEDATVVNFGVTASNVFFGMAI